MFTPGSLISRKRMGNLDGENPCSYSRRGVVQLQVSAHLTPVSIYKLGMGNGNLLEWEGDAYIQ